MLIEKSVELYRLKVEPKFGRPIGAFKTDVVALEGRLGIRLPEAYKQYLLWMGADFHGVLQGSDCFISHVEANAEALTDLLSENGLPELAYTPVVFFMHQGYIGCWFDKQDQSPDPTVFSFSEANSAAGIKTAGKFSDWLYTELHALSESI